MHTHPNTPSTHTIHRKLLIRQEDVQNSHFKDRALGLSHKQVQDITVYFVKCMAVAWRTFNIDMYHPCQHPTHRHATPCACHQWLSTTEVHGNDAGTDVICTTQDVLLAPTAHHQHHTHTHTCTPIHPPKQGGSHSSCVFPALLFAQ